MIYFANDLYKTAYRDEMNPTAKGHRTCLRRFHGLSFWDAWVICSRRIYKTSDTRSEAAADSLWNCFPDPEWKSRRGSIAFLPRSRLRPPSAVSLKHSARRTEPPALPEAAGKSAADIRCFGLRGYSPRASIRFPRGYSEAGRP